MFIIKYTIDIADLDATKDLACLLAKHLTKDLTICLNGDLGMGKTTLVRYILNCMGITDRVKSPTFTLVEPYRYADLDIYHFDLYRINGVGEWDEMGFNDYFTEHSIRFIEWSEKALESIPAIDILINIYLINESRQIEIIGKSTPGVSLVQKLQVS